MASCVGPSFCQYWIFLIDEFYLLYPDGLWEILVRRTLHTYELNIYLCVPGRAGYGGSLDGMVHLLLSCQLSCNQLTLHVSGPIRTIHATLGHFPIRHIPERLLH